MDFGDLLDGIDRSVRDFMDDADEVMPEELGIDRRAADRCVC